MKITEHRTKEILNWLDDHAADRALMLEEMAMFRDAASLVRQLQAEVQDAWHAGLDAGREQGKGNEHCRSEAQPVAEIGMSDDGYKIGYLIPLRAHRLPIGTKLFLAAPPSVPEAQAQEVREADYTDIANRVQEITGRSIWPSTVKAVLEVAGHPAHPSVPVGVEDWLIGDLMEAEEGGHTTHTPAELCGLAAKALKSLIAQQPPSVPVGVEAALSLLRAGHWREVHVGRRYMRLEVTYDYAAWERLREQVEAALAQQPGAIPPSPEAPTMTADTKLLPLPESDCQPNALRWWFPVDQRERVQDYARANVAHATAPLQAEIEALKVDVEAWKASHSMLTDTCHHFQARAKRLAEALHAALRDHDQEEGK